MIHIFTHNDLDGYAAGYVILQALGKQNCKVTHLNYDKEPALEDIKSGDTVYITDYSLTNDQYRQILNLVGEEGKLVWCDHHITAIERYLSDEDLTIDGIRSIKYCGALLTWCYFNDIDTEELNDLLSYDDICKRVPEWLLVVDAWDTWKLDSIYREKAELLNTAVSFNLSMETIANIEQDMSKYIDIGKHYNDYKNLWSSAFRDKYMFKRTISGSYFDVKRDVNIAILNVGCANSTYFGDVIDEVDVCITMCFNGTSWIVSMYSNKDDINCAYCAKLFGGGGHKSAAGCSFAQLVPPSYIMCDKIEKN